jgi:hypothetical protein
MLHQIIDAINTEEGANSGVEVDSAPIEECKEDGTAPPGLQHQYFPNSMN